MRSCPSQLWYIATILNTATSLSRNQYQYGQRAAVSLPTGENSPGSPLVSTSVQSDNSWAARSFSQCKASVQLKYTSKKDSNISKLPAVILMLRWDRLHQTDCCNCTSARSTQQGLLSAPGKHLYKRAPQMETEVFSTGCMCTEEAAKLCTMASPAFTVSGERGQPVLTQAGATADRNSSSLPLVHCCKNGFNTFFLMSLLNFFVSLKLPPEDQLNGITACSCAR